MSTIHTQKKLDLGTAAASILDNRGGISLEHTPLLPRSDSLSPHPNNLFSRLHPIANKAFRLATKAKIVSKKAALYCLIIKAVKGASTVYLGSLK
jgi:hypothetical protein